MIDSRVVDKPVDHAAWGRLPRPPTNGSSLRLRRLVMTTQGRCVLSATYTRP
jgi:hypothetical protein